MGFSVPPHTRTVVILMLLCTAVCGCWHGSARGRQPSDYRTNGGPDAGLDDVDRTEAAPAHRRVTSRIPDPPVPEANPEKFTAIRREAIGKLVPIIREARSLDGEDKQVDRAQFAQFKESNPEYFTFAASNAPVKHIDVTSMDRDREHTQVFIWVWLDDIGVIGFSDAHIESTHDRGLFDAVVAAGRGTLRSHTVTSFEDGVKRIEHVPAGPAD